MEKELSICRRNSGELEKELSQTKKKLKEKNEDLNDAKEELKVKGRELSVLTALWEKHLGLFVGKEDYNKVQEELSLCKKNMEKIEKELKETKYKSNVEEKRANAFEAALKCLVTFLSDLDTCLGKDFDYKLMEPTLSDKKYVESLEELKKGVTASKISAKVLEIVEQQNFAQE